METKRALKILNSIKIERPCHESWEKMEGSVSKRFCRECSECVTNISELTEKEAAKVLAQSSQKRVCIRYVTNRDGTIKFKSTTTLFGCISNYARVLLATFLTFVGISHRVYADSQRMGEQDLQTETRTVLGDVAIPPESSITPTPTSTPASRGIRDIPTATLGMVSPPQNLEAHPQPHATMGKFAAPRK